ncbi:DNA excision repair protein ERCC-8 [Fasciolopsis buskii]|uniref:DNA excision repair protein ERCC-8 n=1 Tax=Fasciolopsis buskii TaxID=27845 RepID=A0A8E0RUS0_9TREM|nr:DNA excision repair protein ERCC-8 [Fasciolopsis buski]
MRLSPPQCVDTIELQESISWIALSDCSRTHNLIGTSLGPNGTGRAVLVDPLISAVAISLAGGHSQAGLSQLCWSPRSSHVVITSGFDGRVLFWDIRATRKPIYSLDRYFGPDSLAYSNDAFAHTGPVLGLTHSRDGMHLFTWGGAGASENTLCLRMWSSAPGEWDLPHYHNSDKPSLSVPQLRPVNFGVIYAESVQSLDPESVNTRGLDPLTPREQQGPHMLSSQPIRPQPVRSNPQWIPVRLDTAWCPSGEAWGARSSFVFVPCRSRLLIALATRQGSPSRIMNRHYSKVINLPFSKHSDNLLLILHCGSTIIFPVNMYAIKI